MEIVVNVTKRDIEQGQRADCLSCPVALALKRRFPGKTVYVSNDHAEVGSSTPELSQRAKDFISRFDDGESVKPIRFKLQLPEHDFEHFSASTSAVSKFW